MTVKNKLLFSTLLIPVAVIVQAPLETEAADEISVQTHINPHYAEIELKQPDTRTVLNAVTTQSEIPEATSLKEMQEILLDGFRNFEATITIKTQTKIPDINQFIKETYLQDSYVHGTYYGGSIKTSIKGGQYTYTFEVNYLTNAAQEEMVDQYVKTNVAKLVKPGMSDFEKVRVINEFIVLNTTYSFNTKTTPHAAYAIVTEGKGVCQAYALLAYKMLKEAGIENIYVTGDAGKGNAKELHAWNLVKVDGEWYHLDTTWSDPTFGFSDPNLADYISYDYFLVSDQVIKKDHEIDHRPGLPVATSERFSALRSNMSSLFGLNGIRYYLLPEYVDGNFYYVNHSDKSYQINRINLLAPTPTVELFADVEAMDILAANNAIYFVDVGMFQTMGIFGLSKIDLATKEVTQLYKGGTVTSIKKDEHYVYAYNGCKEVYREPITEKKPVEPEVPVHIKEIEEALSSIVYLSKDFSTAAQQLLAKVEAVGSNLNQWLGTAVIDKVNEIQQKYNKMKNLTFNQTTAWKEKTEVSEAKKSWSVKLSQPIKNNEQNLKNIQVVDMFGDAVDVTVTVEKGNTIRVTPKANYVEEIPYTLVILADLENDKGVKLSKGTHLTFTFE